MPLSALVTSKFSTTTIVRPCAFPSSSSSSKKFAAAICNHGHGKNIVPSSIRSLATLRYTRSSTRCMPVPTVQKRMKMICSHKNFASDLNELFKGNTEYVANMEKDNPGLLEKLAVEGQKPPFMVVDCSDSRVSEQDIFSAQPGTMFTAGNIANRFDEDDMNSNAVLSFAVETLKVKHVVVMGHYGCGGVASSMLPVNMKQLTRPSDIAVQTWIDPIRKIYENSQRPEIIEHRERYRMEPMTELPGLHDPAFRALVEENVKSNVEKVAKSAVIRDHYASVASSNDIKPEDEQEIEVFIHGWVYDVENGKVSDLGVSVGPPGKRLPPSPFPLVGCGKS